MRKVFLSHSSTDKPIVRQVSALLRPFPVKTWLDEREIRAGDSLYGKIAQGIGEADTVLLFVSPQSVASKWVERELYASLAKEGGDKSPVVIPILLQDVALPTLIADRLYVRWSETAPAKSLLSTLAAIFRDHAVMLVRPRESAPHELDAFTDELAENRQACVDGKLLCVFDHFDITHSLLKLASQAGFLNSHEPARFRAATPLAMEMFTAFLPNLLATALRLFSKDVAAPAAAEAITQLVWRQVMLSLVNYVLPSISIEVESMQMPIRAAAKERNRLIESRERYMQAAIFPFQYLVWYEHHKLTRRDFHDIGFVGCKEADGTKIRDAVHVPIPRGWIREDSLTVFSDTPPECEFLTTVWAEKVMPFIVATAILDGAFTGATTQEWVKRTGLLPGNYARFGIE